MTRFLPSSRRLWSDLREYRSHEVKIAKTDPIDFPFLNRQVQDFSFMLSLFVDSSQDRACTSGDLVKEIPARSGSIAL